MNKYIKPSSLAFYLLLFMVFFIIGAAAAGLSGVAKNQGLAGGAIVLGYGLITALGGIVLAILVISKASIDKIKKANWIILLILLLLLAFLSFRYKSKTEVPEEATTPPPPKTITTPVKFISKKTIEPAFLTIGLGLFTPNYYERDVLYFYAVQNFDKPIEDNPKLDSITFARTEHGDFTIKTAPPWLEPEHMKLDYGILYFKIIRIGKDYILIEGNSTKKLTYYVSKWSGDIILWPEFILSTFMLEFPEGKTQPVKIKPQDNASAIQNTSPFMRAISIQDFWVEVETLDDQWKPIGKGWIKWRDESGLLVQYSLLS
ncbi:hypothetical protein SYJ56_17945 [Algoriphagus sp. D3-2-R+10]|uniref:hypothetical protein n=1 Tax=Algoriphagus aurantiacus TaxID=3103948 RepID=UPI002B3C784B|nr:hypothetical protein [Algoriphagus sp. D3-2-R+10]MEB2777203.1 hypothetical protein [Algoriphagus sp. D3-2-R+10]